MLTSDRVAQADVVDRATVELRARIVDLRLAPGQPVPEIALAAELGMDRVPLREALTLLCEEGLVARGARRSFVVTVPSVEQMQEVYEIVGALEAQAVRRAAREAGPILLGALGTALEEQEDALRRDDWEAWAWADRRFHELLREASGNRQMRAVYRQLDGEIQRVRRLIVPFRGRPTRSTEAHRAILVAIQRRDVAGAVAVHQAHRERGDREVLAALARFVETLRR